MGCNDCVYCLEGLRDDNDEPCTACELMPSNDPAGCGYRIIDGIDHTKERMWFCPLKEEINRTYNQTAEEITNIKHVEVFNG